MTGKTVRAERVSATRELILAAAERLFAEHGVFAVSNRQVSEAAGQGNNTAVGYHFGTKADLVRAIARKHAEQIERLRLRMVAEIGDSADVRDWVACLVRPVDRASGRPGQSHLVRPVRRPGDDRSRAPRDHGRGVAHLALAAADHRRAEPVPSLAAGRGARRARVTWPVS